MRTVHLFRGMLARELVDVIAVASSAVFLMRWLVGLSSTKREARRRSESELWPALVSKDRRRIEAWLIVHGPKARPETVGLVEQFRDQLVIDEPA